MRLTDPWLVIDGLNAHQFKVRRYSGLVAELLQRGYKPMFAGSSDLLFTVEAGARGLHAPRTKAVLGLISKPLTRSWKSRVKTLLSDMTRTSINCSYVIYLNRDNPNWINVPLCTF